MKAFRFYLFIFLLPGFLFWSCSKDSKNPLSTDNNNKDNPDGTAAKWTITTVDSNGMVGDFTSMKVTATGYPHISYRDITNWKVKYARWNGSTWNIHDIGIASTYTSLVSGGRSSLALDNNGYPHITFFQFGIPCIYYYTRWDGASWTPAIGIDMPVDKVYNDGTALYYLANMHHALIVNRYSGVAHISMVLWGSMGYALAYWNSNMTGGAKIIEQETGNRNSITLNQSGQPRISYESRISPAKLKHTAWNGSQWDFETVAPISGTSGVTWEYQTATAIDSKGFAHIAYFNWPYYQYSYWNGSGWPTMTVANEGGPGSAESISIVLDNQDKPHIALLGTGYQLKYAYWNGEKWTIEVVDTDSGDSGYDCSIAMDSNQNVHISYNYVPSISESHLRYAKRTK